MKKILLNLLFTITTVLSFASENIVLRVGHFPNITHAQGIIGHSLTRQNKGWFEERLGPNVKIEWYVYNDGPTAVESIFTGSIDLTYVGPSPTINAYIQSDGKNIRIISGASSGGAALVVQGDGQIKTDADFKGKTVATPQFGGTQDIAARVWLKSKGFNIKLNGGDVRVVPTSNSDQLGLFKLGSLDAAWTVEPWVSRLELEANGKIYFEEKTLWKETDGKYVTAHLVSSESILKKHPEIIKKFIAAHIALTQWINEHPEEAKDIILTELQKETSKTFPKKILDLAWNRFEVTYDPIKASLYKYAEDAYSIGFLKKKPDLSLIYDLKYMNQVLSEKEIQK